MMGPAGQRWGQAGLEAAGYYDDGLSREELNRVHRGWDEATPTWKLRSQPGGIVLLATGAFSPLHLGHVAMVEAAAGELERRGHEVSGGYIAPDHDGYVMSKAGGQAALGAPWRIRLAQLALEDHPWMMVDPWLALCNRRDLNYTEAYLRLQGMLDRRGRQERACLVIGEDNAGFARAFMGSGMLAIVQRLGGGAKADAELALPELSEAQANGRIFRVPAPTEAWGLSSTKVRESQREDSHPGLHDAVSKQVKEWGIDLGRLREQPPAPQRPDAWYALRGDLGWATSHWEGKIPQATLTEKLQRFEQQLRRAIERAFMEASWPDGQRHVETRIIEIAPQQAKAEQIARHEPSINLDLVTAGTAGERLDLTREFERSGPQLHGLRMVPRPGSPSIPQQLGTLEEGPRSVALIDDDVASGQTTRLVSALLETRGIKVERTEPLLEEGGIPPLDVCDLRDFLIGSRQAGLTTQMEDGSLGRMPYLWPWVDLCSRASIPPGSVERFSMELWRMNYSFFEGTGLSLGDLWPDQARFFRERGWPPERPVTELCREAERRLVVRGCP